MPEDAPYLPFAIPVGIGSVGGGKLSFKLLRRSGRRLRSFAPHCPRRRIWRAWATVL